MEHKRVYLRQLHEQDADELLQLRIRNRDYFQAFEPIRSDAHYTLEGQRSDIQQAAQAFEQGQSYIFGIFLEESHTLVGRIALTAVARGPFQNASLGYYLDQAHQGQGYMAEAVSQCVRYAFETAGLHRIQAGVMPNNEPSIRVLQRCGFRYEGLAKRYLQIHGKWEDHQLYALTVEDGWQRS
ncbi:GNAT family N-acetyltransferase [Paenibacillus hexagrammi]|uniref:GNAT family N-acetyltransferase n=1 Tax=Paenibacillus hexagrammi TaxID=2908839 RepID=A0ABY3SHT3_9BACL|nr:GNAT family protein [Paenibacillus sp. YPD9-1]UJF32680.1 GNAT family N-acetyltransferase [Paenibacillus sp. YPD9-1]